MDLGLSNKVAIVTGGSQGIGKAAALRLALEGAKVVICARRMNMLFQAAKEIKELCHGRGDILPVEADVTKDADIRRVISTTIDTFGGLHILVNNAGKSAASSFETVTDEDWRSDIDLKLLAAVRFCRPRHSRDAAGRRRTDYQCHKPRREGPRGKLGADICYQSSGHRTYQGTVQRVRQGQHSGKHRLHRTHQERPA